MNRAEADKIYSEGKESVAAALCSLSTTIEKQQKQIDTLQLKIAMLLKNSSNSGKKPSSDDIMRKKVKQKRVLSAQ